MTKFLKYLSLFVVIAIAFAATDAFAQVAGSGGGGGGLGGGNTDVFQTITDRMITTFKNVRAVIFVVGGFGLVGLGFAAIFGKVNWKWLAALAAGLAIVAIAGAVVDYVTQSDANQAIGNLSSFDDTLS